MNEEEIIELIWNRDEHGINEMQKYYYDKLRHMAENMISAEDAKECINDTWLSVWNSIPHCHPENLFAYTAKICRNHVLNSIKKSKTQKRSAMVVEFSTELQNVIPNVENENLVLEELLNDFLGDIDREARYLFIHRYWYGETIQEISKTTGYSGSKVKSSLFRTRNKLREFLKGRYRT